MCYCKDLALTRGSDRVLGVGSGSTGETINASLRKRSYS